MAASYKPLAHARQGLVIFGLVAESGGKQINSRIKLHLEIACGMALEMAFEMALVWLFGKPATHLRTMFNQARCLVQPPQTQNIFAGMAFFIREWALKNYFSKS